MAMVYSRFQDHRLVALDGTSLIVPNTPETREKFGVVQHTEKNGTGRGIQVEAKMSVLYDVLNKIPLSTELSPGRTNDLKAGKLHLEKLLPGDLLVADRAFGSYLFFAEILKRNADFVIRCKENSFQKYHQMFSNGSQNDVTVEMVMPPRLAGIEWLPKALRVRFIRIKLEGGEIEVLVSSLVDRKRYPYRIFKNLYYQRWKIETFFHTLKSRLSIDNFTGRTVESIYQDVYSTIFVSAIESLLVAEANEELAAKRSPSASSEQGSLLPHHQG